MPSESGEGRPSRVQQSMGHPPPPHTDPLPCPRCHSSNTKFCYYNNYNLSQPRHFCKACRRYWTQGGTLRDVPVGGGGSRKNSKRRSRSSSSNSSTSCSPSSSSLTQETIIPSTPISLFAGGANPEAPSEDNNVVGNMGGFTSLLNSQLGPGFLALGGGYGSGLGHGFEEIGLGPLGYAGRGVWAFPEVGDFGSVNNGGASGCNTWQMMTGAEGGLVDGDCFAWPELEISMPGKGLK